LERSTMDNDIILFEHFEAYSTLVKNN